MLRACLHKPIIKCCLAQCALANLVIPHSWKHPNAQQRDGSADEKMSASYVLACQYNGLRSWKHPNAQQRDGSAAAAALDDDGDEERRAFAESFYNPDTSDDYVSTPDDQAGGGDDNAIDRLAGEY